MYYIHDKTQVFIRMLIILVNWFVSSCDPILEISIAPTATPMPTFRPTSTPTPILLPVLEATPAMLDTGWHLLQPGLEQRVIKVYKGQNQWDESLFMLRMNLNQFRLDMAYNDTPQSLENWQTETKAFVVVNGGYFRIENGKYIPNGLTIVNEKTLGSSYDAFAGMLAIDDSGAELRWLADEPYSPNESLIAALQSFPMLIKPGGELGFSEQHEDDVKARRTVIGQDKDGRMLIMAAPQEYFTLHQLSAYLTESDLNLDIAVNLDGGPSSGILVNYPQKIIPAQVLLPLVILAFVR